MSLRATAAICHGVAVKGVSIHVKGKMEVNLVSFDEIMSMFMCHDGNMADWNA